MKLKLPKIAIAIIYFHSLAGCGIFKPHTTQNLPNLTTEQIALEINELIPQVFPHLDNDYFKPVFSYQPKIDKYGPIDDLLLISLDPPYREFPNLFLYKYDKEIERWRRIEEGITLGIKTADKNDIDLHVAGLGVDLIANAEEISKTINYLLEKGMCVSNYGTFIHTHKCGLKNYFIDKHKFPELAKKLIGVPFEPLHSKIKIDSCELFGTPKIRDISFYKKGGNYQIKASTENNQIWIFNFSNANYSGLSNKTVSVENIY